MGIFDFLKSKKKEPEKNKINFSELETWLDDKTKANKQKEQKILKNINEIIAETASILKEKNLTLEKIDLKDRKEQEKLKGIVLENLNIYSHHLDKLIENLRNLKKESLQEMIEHLNKIVFEFKQRSNTHFEKSTILVGKELGVIKETLGHFSNRLNNILEEEKETMESLRALGFIKKEFNEFKKIETFKNSIDSEIVKIDNQLKNLESESDLIKKNIGAIKSGIKYELNQKEKENATVKKGEIEKEIYGLKNTIDFKNLARFFHSDPKKMIIINDYEKDFNRIFEKNDEKSILNLIDDSKKAVILEKIKSIQEQKLRIQEVFGRKDLLEDDALEILKINSSIKNFESDKLKLKKKLEEYEKDILNIKEEIKKEVLGLNGEIE